MGLGLKDKRVYERRSGHGECTVAMVMNRVIKSKANGLQSILEDHI